MTLHAVAAVVAIVAALAFVGLVVAAIVREVGS